MDPKWMLPIVAGLAILLGMGLKEREVNFRPKKNTVVPQLPPDAVVINATTLPAARRSELVGGLMLVAIGTFGVNQLLRFLIRLSQCGLGHQVGSCVVIEHDAQLRRQFQSRVPAEYRDGRIVYGFSEYFSGGMANRPIAETMHEIDIWGESVVAAAREVIDLHLRQNRGRAPSDILLFQSLGGQAATGIPLLATLSEHFSALVVAFTSLPRHRRLRERWQELKSAYEAFGCWGWILGDNLSADPVTADYGMVAIPLALSSATLYGDRSPRLNNTLSLALTRQPGAVLVYQVVTSEVVGWSFQPDAKAPPVAYYTLRNLLKERVSRTRKSLREGKGIWSADLPIVEDDTSTFDIILANVRPDGLLAVEDAIATGEALAEKFLPLFNLRGPNGKHHDALRSANAETIYASTRATIDPSKPVCEVVGVRLAAVQNGADLVGEIVKPPNDRRFPPGTSAAHAMNGAVAPKAVKPTLVRALRRRSRNSA